MRVADKEDVCVAPYLVSPAAIPRRGFDASSAETTEISLLRREIKGKGLPPRVHSRPGRCREDV